MIPIRDHNPTGRFPAVTYILIATNILVFLYMVMLPLPDQETFISNFAFIPAQILQGRNLISLFTSMFLHGGLGHIFSNMLFLHIFGDNLEDRFGHIKYLLFYILSGLGAALAQIMIGPQSHIPTLGASGAIAGLMGGYLTLFPKHRVDVLLPLGFFWHTISVPAFAMLFYWFIAQFISGFGQLATIESGGVAYFAHIGGFAVGFLLTLIFRMLIPERQRLVNWS